MNAINFIFERSSGVKLIFTFGNLERINEKYLTVGEILFIARFQIQEIRDVSILVASLLGFALQFPKWMYLKLRI